MTKLFLVLALVAIGCGGEDVTTSGSAVDGIGVPAGTWACSLDGSKLILSTAGAYSAGSKAGTYAVQGKQLAFSAGLDGFCQLTGAVFDFTVASSTSDLSGAVMYLAAPSQVCPLNHVP